MDQTVRISTTQLGGDPNRTQLAQPTQMGFAGGGQGGPSLALKVRVGNRYAYAGDRTRAHVMTQLVASAAATGGVGGKRLPVNVCLVIDRSGSMEGSPMEYVKRACSHVVDLLTPEDVLSIVTFEESVEVLMPARRVTDPALIKQHLQRIVAGTTTNLFDGLYAGGAQVASVPLEGYVTRVLLLTDGEPTAGLKDFQSIVSQVGDLKARGITVTALGFGHDYNEELMAGIARRSGGNYYFIERPEQIPEVFQKEMLTILGVTAKNVRLTLSLPRGVTVRQCYGSPPELGARHAALSLPELERGATLTKLWELDYDPHAVATFRTAKVIVSYDDSATGKRETITANAVVEFVGDAALAASGVDPQVAQELAALQAARDLEKTMMGMRTQQLNLSELTATLQKTQQIFTQQGNTEAAKTVQQAAQAAQRGDASGAEKTLIGTIYNLDLGKR